MASQAPVLLPVQGCMRSKGNAGSVVVGRHRTRVGQTSDC